MENGLSLGILIYGLCLTLFFINWLMLYLYSIAAASFKAQPIERVRSVCYVLMNVVFHIFKDKLKDNSDWKGP